MDCTIEFSAFVYIGSHWAKLILAIFRIQNTFSPFPKAWNQSFDWILSLFYPLLAGGDPRAKMLRPIRKRPNPLNIQSNDAFSRWQKGKKQSVCNQPISTVWLQAFGKVEKALCTRIFWLILYFDLLFELLSLYHAMCLYVCVCVYPKKAPEGPFGQNIPWAANPR